MNRPEIKMPSPEEVKARTMSLSPEEESAGGAYQEVMLDPERAREMLDALDIEVVSENGDEVTGLCPMHEERTGKVDHNPSWGFNLVTGLSHCLSCGHSANALSLVVDVKHLRTKWDLPDWDAARAWISSFELDLAEKVARSEHDYQRPERSKKLVAMTEARLAVFDAQPPLWALRARKLDQEACERYGVLWDPKTDCWITPLRDPETKKLLGYQQKGQGNRYFRNRPPGMKKSQTLFGIDTFEGGTMIVVESPLDALRLDTLGYSGAVSSCGAKLSAAQVELMSWRATDVILALDNDSAGMKGREGFAELASKAGLSWSCINYRGISAKDVGDMKDVEVDWVIEHAVPSIYGMRAMASGVASLDVRL